MAKKKWLHYSLWLDATKEKDVMLSYGKNVFLSPKFVKKVQSKNKILSAMQKKL